MKDKALAYLHQVKNLWGSLSRAKRVMLVLLTCAVLVGSSATAVLGSRISYQYLYTDLSQEDAAGIVAKLNELKIPHEIEAGGSAILVPREQVHEVRLQLASMGLPRGGGVGFEIFDQSQFGSTEFEQQVNFRRALEGELSRTISTIDAVRAARVHLVLPERSVFVMRKQEGSASVVLQLQPGRGFSRREVTAVVHLVASAVPGLSPNRVSVVNADGTTLHRPRGDEDDSGMEEAFVERELEMARSLERRAQELLERVVGRGRADVRVRLALDARVRERTEEHFNPASTALRSEHRTVEGTSGTRNESGVPGPASNLPDGEGDSDADEEGEDFPSEEEFYLETEGRDSKASRESWTRNWEIDRVLEKTSTPAGAIQRLSVAVLVDGTYEQVDGQPVFKPREEAELKQLESLVRGAVGFDEARGDVVSIESARFAVEDVEEPLPSDPLIPTSWLRWYYAAIPTALLLALGMGVGMLWTRRRRTSKSEPEPLLLKGSAAAEQLDTALGNVPGLPAHTQSGVMDLDDLRQRAVELADRDPDTASAIIREWLNAAPNTHPNLSAATVEAES